MQATGGQWTLAARIFALTTLASAALAIVACAISAARVGRCAIARLNARFGTDKEAGP